MVTASVSNDTGIANEETDEETILKTVAEGDGNTQGALQDETDDNDSNELSGNSVKNVVFSELLCYIRTYMNCSAPDNIKRIILSSFTGEQILAAKQVLWNSHVGSSLPKYVTRKSTPQRSDHVANLNDIVDGLQDIDKNRLHVVFAAVDLTSIPRHRPEDINEMAVLDRISVLEEKLKELQNTASQHYITANEADRRISKLEENTATQDVLLQQLAEDKQQKDHGILTEEPNEVEEQSEEEEMDSSVVEDDEALSENSNSDSEDEVTTAPPASQDAKDTTSSVNRQINAINVEIEGPENQKSPKGQLVRPSYAQKTSMKKEQRIKSSGRGRVISTTKIKAATSENGRYRPIAAAGDRQNFGHPNKSAMNFGRPNKSAMNFGRPNKSAMNFGRPNMSALNQRNDGFSIPRYHQRKQQRNINSSSVAVFISKVDKQVDCEKMYSYLQSTGVVLKGLYQRSHPNASYKSFVVNVAEKDFNKILHKNLWEEGIEVRQYKPSRSAFQ